MAADSAQTVGPEWGQKIFTSADKIFALCWEDPVGVMIYGNAELLGLPWETIVKEYRRKTAGTSFATVDDHARAFLSFIASEELFSSEIQNSHYIALIEGYYRMMREQIRKSVQDAIAKAGSIDDSRVTAIVKSIVDTHCSLWDSQARLDTVPAEFASSVKKRHEEAIRTAIKEVFEKLPLTEPMKRKLVDLAVSLSSKWPPQSISPPSISGVVISGFGRAELFPVLRESRDTIPISARVTYLSQILLIIRVRQTQRRLASRTAQTRSGPALASPPIEIVSIRLVSPVAVLASAGVTASATTPSASATSSTAASRWAALAVAVLAIHRTVRRRLKRKLVDLFSAVGAL